MDYMNRNPLKYKYISSKTCHLFFIIIAKTNNQELSLSKFKFYKHLHTNIL